MMGITKVSKAIACNALDNLW